MEVLTSMALQHGDRGFLWFILISSSTAINLRISPSIIIVIIIFVVVADEAAAVPLPQRIAQTWCPGVPLLSYTPPMSESSAVASEGGATQPAEDPPPAIALDSIVVQAQEVAGPKMPAEDAAVAAKPGNGAKAPPPGLIPRAGSPWPPEMARGPPPIIKWPPPLPSSAIAKQLAATAAIAAGPAPATAKQPATERSTSQ